MKELSKILTDYGYYCDYDTGIVSRFKEIEKYTCGILGYGSLFEIEKNVFLKFINSHLTPYPYGKIIIF
jgi:hypothetical protein